MNIQINFITNFHGEGGGYIQINKNITLFIKKKQFAINKKLTKKIKYLYVILYIYTKNFIQRLIFIII